MTVIKLRKKKETSKEKNKEEDINEVGKSQKDEDNDGCFQFLTTRKKRQKSKAKEKKDESDDGRQRKEESKRRSEKKNRLCPKVPKSWKAAMIRKTVYMS